MLRVILGKEYKHFMFNMLIGMEREVKYLISHLTLAGPCQQQDEWFE